MLKGDHLLSEEGGRGGGNTRPRPSHSKTCYSPSLLSKSGRPARLGAENPLPVASPAVPRPAAARPDPRAGRRLPRAAAGAGRARLRGAGGRGEARRGLPPPPPPAPHPSAHRHQELQRAHVVPLGLEQLIEDADAQAKLLLQVLPAFPLAFPFAFLCHGAARSSGAPSPASFPAAGSAA